MVEQRFGHTMSYIDTISHVNEDFIARWHARQLRVLLLIGLSVIAVAKTCGGILPLSIPEGLCLYLLFSGGYFALTARHRLEHRYQRICTFACFPGAFVTSVLPVYLALIFAVKLIMPD